MQPPPLNLYERLAHLQGFPSFFPSPKLLSDAAKPFQQVTADVELDARS